MGDFSIQDASLDNMAVSFHETDSVDLDLMEMVQKQPGVNETGNIYVSTFWQEFSDESWKILEDNFFKEEAIKDCINSCYTSGSYDYEACMNDYRKSKTLAGNTYGMGKFATGKLSVVETIDGSDKIDWEKFNSGNYVLATRWTMDGQFYINIVEPGDKVQIRSHNPKYAEITDEPVKTGSRTSYTSYENAPVKNGPQSRGQWSIFMLTTTFY